MDINENYGDDTDPVVLKSRVLISLFDLIMWWIALGLSSAQKTLIDRVCRRTYEVLNDRTPTFIDFYNILKRTRRRRSQAISHGSRNLY